MKWYDKDVPIDSDLPKYISRVNPFADIGVGTRKEIQSAPSDIIVLNR